LSHALPLQKISSKSVHKFASNPTDRQTNRQTDKQTAPKTYTSFFGGGNNAVLSLQSIAAAITERTSVQDLLEFVCSCCHLNPSVYFIRFNLPTTNNTATACSDSFKIPDKTTVVSSEVSVLSKLKETQTRLTATGTHMPYGIAQCYLPPLPQPIKAGTRFSDSGGMQG